MYKEGDIVSIYLQLNLANKYSYKIPSFLELYPGDIVKIPFNNKTVFGVVFQKEEKIDFDIKKIKYVISKVEDIGSLNEQLMEFLRWFSEYNMANFGLVLKMALNITGDDLLKYSTYLSLNPSAIKNIKMTKAREKVIKEFLLEEFIEKDKVITQANVSASVIQNLIDSKVLSVTEKIKISNFQETYNYTPLSLLKEQKQVANDLLNTFSSNKFTVEVLQGVPGSGKTEVYFELVNEALKQNKQVLILLPEIGLTSQIVNRFKQRFNISPYVWHSDISKTIKKDTWVAANNGNLRVIIGARSALFLSFKNLGLIIVDEEHDSSYKQEEGIFYNARDMAVIRAKIHNIPIILASATPSLETVHNIKLGKYKHHCLATRANQMALPNMNIIDMSGLKLDKNKCLSPDLINQMRDVLSRKEQILLFVNKRGYSSVFCTSCNETVKCKYCSVGLVYHKIKNIFMCHYCGYKINYTSDCSEELCKNLENTIVTFGVGIEKLLEEVQEIFPDKKTIILSSDTMKTYKDVETIVNEINDNKYDILIGTQIISKGYNFPNLTLVGIINANLDEKLDLKSNEKLWQMLYQVAGRAGRVQKPGSVYIQTYTPNNSLIKYLVNQDYDGLIEHELEQSQKFNSPPFCKYASIIVSSKDEDLLKIYCKKMSDNIPQGENFEIKGPVDSIIYILRKTYRVRFLVISSSFKQLQHVIKFWLKNIEKHNRVKIQIDIDPQSFL